MKYKSDKITGYLKNRFTFCYSDVRVWVWQKSFSDRRYKSGGGPDGGAFS